MVGFSQNRALSGGKTGKGTTIPFSPQAPDSEAHAKLTAVRPGREEGWREKKDDFAVFIIPSKEVSSLQKVKKGAVSIKTRLHVSTGLEGKNGRITGFLP